MSQFQLMTTTKGVYFQQHIDIEISLYNRQRVNKKKTRHYIATPSLLFVFLLHFIINTWIRIE
jgi:hypothetical protein